MKEKEKKIPPQNLKIHSKHLTSIKQKCFSSSLNFKIFFYVIRQGRKISGKLFPNELSRFLHCILFVEHIQFAEIAYSTGAEFHLNLHQSILLPKVTVKKLFQCKPCFSPFQNCFSLKAARLILKGKIKGFQTGIN